MATRQEDENSEFKPVKIHWKTDLVSHPSYAKELGKYITDMYP